MLTLLQNKFWTQLVRGPTHVDGNTLDLVIPSTTELVAKVEVMDYLGPGCDHNMILTNLVGPARDQTTKEEVPDWSKADYNAMREAFEAVNWEEEFSDKGGEECMDLFYSVIQRETDKCIPKKMRRIGSRPIWMNKNILRMIRKKKRIWKAYSSQDYYQRDFQSFQAYKKLQSDVKKAVQQAKRKLEKSLAKNAKKNPKAFYSYLKKKNCNKVSVGPLIDGENLVTDDSQMAELLNNFFCSVFTREKLADMPEPEQLYRGDEPLTEADFKEEDVRKKLTNLKPSAAPGPDGVWTRILQKLADVLAKPLSLIFTKLFADGCVPGIWKKANVCPVFKKGVKGDTGNYRPISLTCVVGKLMESLLRDRILQHLVLHQLIRVSQHGFMSGRSTLTNLLAYLETLTTLVDEGHAVDVLYLDFAKAFDKVPHARLLAKCRGLGIGGKVVSWVEEWLTGRQQRVVLNGKYSEWGDVGSGVPQGSVLGPLLFVIYINDIDCAVDVAGSTLLKFADDTKWSMVVDTVEQNQTFQEGLSRLEGWSREWQMVFNSGKCHVLHLGSRNREYEWTGKKMLVSLCTSLSNLPCNVPRFLLELTRSLDSWPGL